MTNLLLCLNSSAILKSVYKQEKESCRKPYVHLGILFTSFLKAKFPVFFLKKKKKPRCVIGNKFILFLVVTPRNFTPFNIPMN